MSETIETITLRFRGCDGWSRTATYKTLAGAQKAAQKRFGKFPEFGGGYATDGYATVRVEGAKLKDLFPEAWAQWVAEMSEQY